MEGRWGVSLKAAALPFPDADLCPERQFISFDENHRSEVKRTGLQSLCVCSSRSAPQLGPFEQAL